MTDDDKSKIIAGLLTRLNVKEDSLEVKGVAVKGFGEISKYLKDNDIMKIFSELIKYIVDPKAEGKDIYTSCIKKIFEQMGGNSCFTVGKILVPELIKGISSKNELIKELCFDTFSDYINKFDYVLINKSKESEEFLKKKEDVIKIALDDLNTSNETLKNTIGLFLGNFSLILSKNQLNTLIDNLFKRFSTSKELRVKISNMVVLNLVAKVTGARHGT